VDAMIDGQEREELIRHHKASVPVLTVKISWTDHRKGTRLKTKLAESPFLVWGVWVENTQEHKSPSSTHDIVDVHTKKILFIDNSGGLVIFEIRW